MHILVFNGGSSSLSYKVFDFQDSRKVEVVLKGKAHRVGVKGTGHAYIENSFKGKSDKDVVDIPDHATAAALAAKYIVDKGIRIDAVGHRFVHGGEYFKRSAILDADNLAKVKACLPLAPLHNPISYHVIQEAMKVFADIPHYVVIDSAFHSTIPSRAYRYPLPQKIVDRFKFRRFGFHGISYSYVTDRMPELLQRPSEKLNMIVCHLGTGGASVMAVEGGVSVDTSMGFSPNSGLIMSTRSGDIDPVLLLYLVQNKAMTPRALEAMLNNKSGLRGISGFSSDITDIIRNVDDAKDGEKARLALEMYVHRLKSYIGSYILALKGRVDALVFTDDIGAGSPFIRQKVCASLGWAGIIIDQEKNDRAPHDQATFVQSSSSMTSVVSIPTEEELMICLEGGRILKEKI
ncbi:MAG: acetate/propionate family kinase [Candidatus Omnitrophica bacterium]|nr:acetate/propionate family kinase [Candidatus Omnitrophota bacterium]